MSAHRNSAATGRLRRSDEQQELWGNFVDKHVQENFGEEAAPAARRDESGPITLFRSTAASRREPTGEMGAAALDRAASEARAAAADRPTWQLEKRVFSDCECLSVGPSDFEKSLFKAFTRGIATVSCADL